MAYAIRSDCHELYFDSISCLELLRRTNYQLECRLQGSLIANYQLAGRFLDGISGDGLKERLVSQFSGRGAVIALAGPDGSGKTTLAKALANLLCESGVNARRVHCHAWYMNVFVQPLKLKSSIRKGEVVILDRSLIDNIVEISGKLKLPFGFWKVIFFFYFGIKRKNYFRVFMYADIGELAKRRPEESTIKQEYQLQCYQTACRIGRFGSIKSDENALLNVCNYLLTK